MDQRPVSVKLFLREGLPKGMRTAEIVGWTGIALICPRSRLDNFHNFPRSDSAAVYLLLGEDESGKPMVYVGQTGSIGNRLKVHLKDSDKDFFTDVIAFVSKDENLTTAHVTYLEARLLQMAKQAGQAEVNNPNQNLVAKGLPESDVADMNNFIDNITTLLLALGVTIFEIVTITHAPGPTPATTPLFELHSSGVSAQATEASGEFVVLMGSQSRGSVGTQDSYKDQRDTLIANGVLARAGDDKPYVFTRDYPFKSPSAASAVVLGRNDNGRTSWKVQGINQTYAQWEANKVTTPGRENI
jgi:hypothetical protein